MDNRSLIDQLDAAVDALRVNPDTPLPADPELATLLRVAAELRDLPREDFKARLKADLEGKVAMTTAVKAVPEVYQGATPYLCCKNAAAAIEFYKKAFGAVELMRIAEPGGKVGHAEIRIGAARIMLADEYPDIGVLSPETIGGSPVTIHLYVEDVDALAVQAIAAGAKVMRPVADQFYGDRAGKFEDPFGHAWFIATHKEDVSPEEIERRAAASQPEAAAPARVSPIRAGFHTVTPYLIVQQAAELVDFVKAAFGATELFRTTGSAGGMHCEVRIGNSMVMIGGAAVMPFKEEHAAIYLYVDDVDATYQRALQAGATSTQAPADQPYGDRTAFVADPFGNTWFIATHQRDAGAH